MKKSIMVTCAAIAAAAMLSLNGSALADEAATEAASEAAGEPFRVGMECNYAPFNWTTTEEDEFTQPITGTGILPMVTMWSSPPAWLRHSAARFRLSNLTGIT